MGEESRGGAAQHAAAGGERPLSVLFLAGEYPPRPGGVGDYTALLAQHLADQGLRVAVLATCDAPQRIPTHHSSLITHHAVPVWRAVPRWDWRRGPTVLAAARAARADI